jgi:predicted nucleic acid-binding protein
MMSVNPERHLVLDNTVLPNFALIGHADWLKDLWPGELITSQEAWAELLRGVQLELIPETDWSWLTVLTLTEAECKLRDEWMPPLDRGEAACLALAYIRAYAFLTDDRVARREARRRGVPLSGTIGALQSLVNEEHISMMEAEDALQQMITLGYHSPVQSLKELHHGPPQ